MSKQNTNPTSKEVQDAIGDLDIKIMIDSGAFTVWTQGSVIDIDKYIDFYHEHAHRIDYLISLDVIPGRPGKKNTNIDVEQAAKQGWENYQYILKKNVPANKVVHTFHQGDSFNELNKLLDCKPTLMALSPANDKNTKDRSYWIDECIRQIKIHKSPTPNFHGLAVTSHKLIKRYPWFSVDSATWRIYSGFGGIYLPLMNNDGIDWTKQNRVSISKDERSKKKPDHIENRSQRYRDMIFDLFDQYDFNYNQLQDHYKYRAEWNAFYFSQLQKYSGKQMVLAAVDPPTLIEALKGWRRVDNKNLTVLLSYEYIKKDKSGNGYLFSLKELTKNRKNKKRR